ncbi:MAG: metallophosphoesterase [Actinobacteria bacterium]|nr:metallophosphoesterase [Actinomycetota bacterium]
MSITIIIIISVLAAATALAALIYWYAFIFEVSNFKLSEIEIFLKNQAEKNQAEKSQAEKSKADNIKSRPEFSVLHLSDFHLRKDTKGEKLFRFIQSLKSITPAPDFILITGDLVEKNENFPFLFKMLEGLNACHGKFAVFGVHDYFNKTPVEFLKNMIKRKKEYKRPNDVTELVAKLNSIGIEVLRNENMTFGLDNETVPIRQIKNVEIIGVEDSIIKKTDVAKAFAGLNNSAGLNNKLKIMPLVQQHNSGKAVTTKDEKNMMEKDIMDSHSDAIGRNKNRYAQTFKSCNNPLHTLNTDGSIRIVLTHTPDMDLLVDLSDKNVDVVLCGHTHGGQVRLPGAGALISGCNIKTKYCSGLFYFNNFVLYTTRGLGEGRYSPFRFYCQPEATLIKFY